MTLVRLYEASEIKHIAGKKKRFVSTALSAGKATRNGRVYPRNEIEKNVNELQSKIKRKRLLGRLEHSSDPQDYSNASHIVLEAFLNGDDLIVKGELLDNKAGETAAALLKSGSELGLSIMAYGEVTESFDGLKHVSGLRIISFDLVLDPSFENVAQLTERKIDDSISPSDFLRRAILSSKRYY